MTGMVIMHLLNQMVEVLMEDLREEPILTAILMVIFINTIMKETWETLMTF